MACGAAPGRLSRARFWVSGRRGPAAGSCQAARRRIGARLPAVRAARAPSVVQIRAVGKSGGHDMARDLLLTVIHHRAATSHLPAPVSLRTAHGASLVSFSRTALSIRLARLCFVSGEPTQRPQRPPPVRAGKIGQARVGASGGDPPFPGSAGGSPRIGIPGLGIAARGFGGPVSSW
jgi:hypothetical protein